MSDNGNGRWGIIACGGGVRTVFDAGAFAALRRYGFLDCVDWMIGISGGAAIIPYVLTGQIREGYEIWTKHVPEGLVRINRWPILDLRFLTETVFQERVPLDILRLRASHVRFEIAATSGITGRPIFIDGKSDALFPAIRGSCALFPLTHPEPWNGDRLFDGGYAAPIPLHRMVEGGCRNILVLLPFPIDERADATPHTLRVAARLLLPRRAASAVIHAPSRYNDALFFLQCHLREPNGVRVTVVAPKGPMPVGRLTCDPRHIEATMQMGFAAMRTAIAAKQFP